MLDLTLDALKTSVSHPMARELRLRIILFSLRVLRVSSAVGKLSQWRLKDKILSAGLSWFKYSPKWSYGSNQLQLKTELRLISDVIKGIQVVSYIANQAVGSFKVLAQKEALLLLLLENEQGRLNVWVHPTQEAHHNQHHQPDGVTSHGKGGVEVSDIS
jgi:phosphatidylinositol 4-kinase A